MHEIYESSIIVIGNFNPAIFSPFWLEKNNLIGSEDAKGALTSPNLLITSQIFKFETEWFVLQVIPQQFSLSSKGAISPTMKDLAVEIFSLLPHTPISALGINFMAHYKIQNVDEYYKIGDMLAPKTIWDGINFFSEQSTGLENLTIRIDPFKRGEKSITYQPENIKKVIVQPSLKIIPGIYFAYNDHSNIELLTDLQTTKAEYVSGIIKNRWDGIKIEAEKIFEEVLQKTLQI